MRVHPAASYEEAAAGAGQALQRETEREEISEWCVHVCLKRICSHSAQSLLSLITSHHVLEGKVVYQHAAAEIQLLPRV